MNVATALSSGSGALHEAGITEPRREAASLLAFVLNRDNSFLIAHPEYDLGEEEAAAFAVVIERRVEREPFQYITGHQEFFGLDFDVEPGVLIPRPETELLVEAAIDVRTQTDSPKFCEAGVGSGCISVSILKAVPNARAIATDLSHSALDLSRRNAEKHGVDDRLELRAADLLAGLKAGFDLIVSNPPYIPDTDIEGLQAEVKNYEPREALAGGPDGLDLVRRLVADAPRLLKKRGHLIIEIGAGQAAVVTGLFDLKTWAEPVFINDLQDIPRTVVARLNTPHGEA